MANTNVGHCVLRVPLLFGPMEYLEESSVTDLYASLMKGKLQQCKHRWYKFVFYEYMYKYIIFRPERCATEAGFG